MTTPSYQRCNVQEVPRWTPEAVAELRRRYEAGETDEEIGEALGRTANAVQLKRHHLRLVGQRRRPYTDDELAYLKANLDTMTVSAMARHLGRTPANLSHGLAYYGLTPGYKPRYDVYERRTGAKVCSNVTMDEACDRLCISRAAFFGSQNRTKKGLTVRWKVYRINGDGRGGDE